MTTPGTTTPGTTTPGTTTPGTTTPGTTTSGTTTPGTTTPGTTGQPRTTPPATSAATHLWPTLRARDARALIDFLVAAFGFVEVVAHPLEGGGIAHAQLAWPPGGGLMLGSARENSAGDDPWPQRPGASGCYVVTDEPDALFERAVAAGARVVRALESTDYGSREFAVADPEGNLWSFGTYAGEPRP